MQSAPLLEFETAHAWKRRKEQRAPELLIAARDLIEELGYDQVSIAEIGRRAGVSEATVYKYFANKRDLIGQVVHAWMEPSLVALETELPLVEGTAAKLRLLALRHLQGIRDWPGVHRLIYRELRWTDYIGSPLHRLNQRYAHVLHDIIARGIEAGEIDPATDPALVRDMLFGGLEHVGLRVIAGGAPASLAEPAAMLVERLLGGIRAAPEPGLRGLIDRVSRLEATMTRKD